MRKFLFVFLASVTALVTSCTSELSPVQNQEGNPEEQKFGPEMVLGEKLENPYSLKNMQAAYESLMKTKAGDADAADQLEANCLYVRFLPKDSLDIATLQSMELELFDYPLDYDIEQEGESYHDPSIPEDQITWQYTVVKPDFTFPDMEYKILDECYIPDGEAETKAGFSDFASELELAAIERADLPAKYQPQTLTKGFGRGTRPSGQILFRADTNNTEALKGVKVRCHFLVNISSAYTDENGNYTIGHRYVCKPHYAIVYENSKDFAIWGNLAFIAPAVYNLGYYSNTGLNKTVTGGKERKWSIVNNAAYDYYSNCDSSGILSGVSLPPANMKIWCWDVDLGSVGGGTPMIRHLNTSKLLSGSAAILSYTSALRWTHIVTTAMAAAISVMAPDIMMVTHDAEYNDLYATTFHELSHASHFSSIGEWKYGNIIWYEMTHPADDEHLYGKGGTGTDGEGYCAVTESYAFSIENFIRYKVLSGDEYAFGQSESFFFNKYVTILTDLLINGILVPSDIYSCMTPDMKDMDSLLEDLCAKHPGKKTEIRNEMTTQGL